MNTLASPHTHIAPVKNYQKHIYGEKEGGGTQVIMLAGVPFDKLGIPDLEEKSAASRSEGVQHAIYKGMVGPFLLLAGLLYITRKNIRQPGEDHHKKNKEENEQ